MISSLEGWQFVGPKGRQRSASRITRCIQPMFAVKLARQ